MGKRPRRSEGPVTVQLDVADAELRARLVALLGADERYILRWSLHYGEPGDAAILVADRPLPTDVPLLLLADHPSDGHGAAAVLPTDAGADLLGAAITLIAAGLRIGPPRRRPTSGRVDRVARRARPEPANTTVELTAPEPLTTREHEVLVLMGEGASNKMIALRLGVSVHTAKFHVGSVLAKLGARGRSDAIAIALRRGLLLL